MGRLGQPTSPCHSGTANLLCLSEALHGQWDEQSSDAGMAASAAATSNARHKAKKYPNEMGIKLYVGGLSRKVDDKRFTDWCEISIGKVSKAWVQKDRDQRSKGYGFACFLEKRSVDRCLDNAESKFMDFHGSQVEVKLSIDKDKLPRKSENVNTRQHSRTNRVQPESRQPPSSPPRTQPPPQEQLILTPTRSQAQPRVMPSPISVYVPVFSPYVQASPGFAPMSPQFVTCHPVAQRSPPQVPMSPGPYHQGQLSPVPAVFPSTTGQMGHMMCSPMQAAAPVACAQRMDMSTQEASLPQDFPPIQPFPVAPAASLAPPAPTRSNTPPPASTRSNTPEHWPTHKEVQDEIRSRAGSKVASTPTGHSCGTPSHRFSDESPTSHDCDAHNTSGLSQLPSTDAPHGMIADPTPSNGYCQDSKGASFCLPEDNMREGAPTASQLTASMGKGPSQPASGRHWAAHLGA